MVTSAPGGYFLLEPTSGSTRDLGDLFAGKTVVVDRKVKTYVRATAGTRYATKSEMGCRFSGVNYGDVALGSLGSYMIDGNELCALFAHLGGEGSSLLEIQKGSNEMNVVLGHGPVEGKDHVFYAEHEIEDGVDRIHLHAEPPDHREDGPKKVVFFS